MRHSTRFSPNFSCALLAATLAATFSPVPAHAAARKPARKPTPKKIAKPKPAPRKPAPEPKLDDHPLIASLKQLDNGPGVFVGEPVPAPGTSQELAEFGDGCGRWLELIVGGQPELDKSPLWNEAREVQAELKRSDLRLSLAQADTVARNLAVTYLALGELKTEGAVTTLSYGVYQLPQKKLVGKLLTLSGSPQEIVAQLPGLAKGLAITCGAQTPEVPEALGETVEELGMLGALPWVPQLNLASATREALRTQATKFRRAGSGKARSFLAGYMGMMSLVGSQRDEVERNSTSLVLVQQLPRNTMALAEVAECGFKARDPLMDEVRTRIDSLLGKYPRNYQLYRGSAAHYSTLGRWEDARRAAERAVTCMTRNPVAWTSLDRVIARQANAIRHGRVIAELTEQELTECQKYYAEQLPVLLKAVSLNEKSITAWRSLSSAAAAFGAPEIADRAFDEAFKLDRTSMGVIWWGLELYQPKWLDDPEKLRKVANAAPAGADGWVPYDRVTVAISLRHLGFLELVEQVAKTAEERAAVSDYFKKYPESDAPKR